MRSLGALACMLLLERTSSMQAQVEQNNLLITQRAFRDADHQYRVARCKSADARAAQMAKADECDEIFSKHKRPTTEATAQYTRCLDQVKKLARGQVAAAAVEEDRTSRVRARREAELRDERLRWHQPNEADGRSWEVPGGPDRSQPQPAGPAGPRGHIPPTQGPA